MGDLLVYAWFKIFENLSIDVLLRTTFIGRCTHRIFRVEQKIVPWHSKPVEIISTNNAINLTNADNSVFSVNNHSRKDASSKEFNLRRVARQVRMLENKQAAVLVSCQSFGTMTIEIHGNVIERRCSMTARGLMNILLGKRFYIYILIVMANRVNLPKFMILSYVLSAPACIIYARSDEPYMLKNEASIPTQCEHGITDPPVNIVRNKQQERHDEQVDRHNFVKQLDENSHMNWRKEIVVPDQVSTICDIFTRMLEQVESI